MLYYNHRRNGGEGNDCENLSNVSSGTYSMCANFAEGKAETQITVESEPKPTGTYGDVDGDGSITANDALLILRASVSLEEITPDQRTKSDVDGDNDISANDALAVLRNSVGMSDDNLVGRSMA